MITRKKIDLENSFSEKGLFNLTTRRINSEERKKYQVFISHSNFDGAEILETVAGALAGAGVNVAFDRAFLSGGDNFQRIIEENIHCYAGVVLVTPSLLRSDWCNYEIGYFSGKDLNVYLYDPDNLLARDDNRDNQYLNYHLHRYLPAYTTLEGLVSAVSQASVYSELFKNETEEFTKKDFSDIIAKRVDTSVVRLSSPCFEKDRGAFSGCRFNTLVINFGTFATTVQRGKPCYAMKGRTECIEPDNDVCAVLPVEKITDKNMECVLLNYVLNNGTLVMDENLCMEFHVPVHRKFGTEFKFIVDAPDNDKLYRLMSIFEAAGMNPSLSESCNGGRIYLALPERETQGVFNIRGEFSNNFICPKALIDREKRED